MSDKQFFPSRKLGQNFLKDRNILNRICDAADIDKNDHVVEIGPGFGSLTELLCSAAGLVTAVEADYRLFKHLGIHFSSVSNINIVRGDILKTGFRPFYRQKQIKIISNLPYNISSQILFRIIDERDILGLAVIMLQKELADRLLSDPGSRTYGALSVIFQTFFDISRVTKVPSSAFSPKPKIDSTVLKLSPLKEPRVNIMDHDLYRKVVRSSFSARRKIIKNSLSFDFPETQVIKALSEAGIDINRRAESLDIRDFARLANAVYFLQQSISSVKRSF